MKIIYSHKEPFHANGGQFFYSGVSISWVNFEFILVMMITLGIAYLFEVFKIGQ